jgi:hypothetical protein
MAFQAALLIVVDESGMANRQMVMGSSLPALIVTPKSA